MILYADIYSADGTSRLGSGAVRLIDAEITRRLDGIGEIHLTAAGTDSRALSLITTERQARIYARSNDGGSISIRELGRGVIRRVEAAGSRERWQITARGADSLDALTRVNTLLGRSYSQQSPAAIGAALVSLVSGWSLTGSGGNLTDARFDGMSVWRALLALAEMQGMHVRAGDASNTVELGAFGESAGLTLIGASPLQIPQTRSGIALIERISREESSEAAATRLYPVGAGIGEALLSLANSTRTTPYPIQQITGANGQPQYYLEDSAGVGALGVIERFGKFRQVAPLSNSPTDLQNAANALYDLAAAWLMRYSTREEVYRVTCRGVTQSVKPGDKVRVVYRGAIERDGVIVDYLDLDADLWVISVSERASLGGLSAEFLLSTVDRYPGEMPVKIGGLEEVTIDGVQVTSYFNRVAYVYDRLIDPTHPAQIPVRLTNATQKLSRCTLRIKTRPFTATAAAAVGGGITGLETSTAGSGGSSSIAQTDDGGYIDSYYWRNIKITDGAGNHRYLLLPISHETDAITWVGGASGGSHAHAFSIPDHTHTLTYGLQQDSTTPQTLRVLVDGDDYTESLGGAWAINGGSVMFEVDVTAAILASGSLQGEHTITLTCEGGRGSVEASVEIYEVITAIAL